MLSITLIQAAKTDLFYNANRRPRLTKSRAITATSPQLAEMREGKEGESILFIQNSFTKNELGGVAILSFVIMLIFQTQSHH